MEKRTDFATDPGLGEYQDTVKVRATPRPISAAEQEREALRQEGEARAEQKLKSQLAASLTDAILEQRSKTHGDWEIDSTCCQKMTAAFISACHQTNKGNIPAPVIHAIGMTFVKLARMAAGDIYEEDHYQDAIGYLTLALKYIRSREGF